MKSGRGGKLFLLFALGILVLSPFAFAGLAEWWAKLTGKATSWPTGVSVVVGNTAPVIFFVNVSTPASGSGTRPIESAGRVLGIEFNASDADGIANLANASAMAFVNISGDFYYSSSCSPVSGLSGSNSTAMVYNCTVTLPYYAVPGTYSVNASVADINGARIDGWTTWDLGTLRAITIDPNTLSWASISTSSFDIGADNDPITINNTGNANSVDINVTAYDVIGFTNPNAFIYANNFSVHNESQGCNAPATVLANDTALKVNNATLNRGSNSTYGAESIYFCIKGINSNTPSDIYNGTYLSGWQVLILP
jgi:hypothetical protein